MVFLFTQIATTQWFLNISVVQINRFQNVFSHFEKLHKASEKNKHGKYRQNEP
jgi:hypothetical protein